MQRLEVSGVVRLIYRSLGVKGLISRNIPDTLLKVIVDKYTQDKILIKRNSKLSKLAEINNGVRKGCPLSPTPFTVYLDVIITKWQKNIQRISLKTTTTGNVVIC